MNENILWWSEEGLDLSGDFSADTALVDVDILVQLKLL